MGGFFMKHVNKWFFYIGMIFFVPYGITMLMTGVIGVGIGEERMRSGIDIYISEEESIDLEQYVVGTMASQIPADYEMEALKGQAIIQRTNILNEMEREKTNQSLELPFLYWNEEQLQEKWGEKNWKLYYEKLRKAVADTKGMYMTCDGEYIEAYYHAVSIGTTVSAKELLDKDISYLQSVESTKDVESKDYMNIHQYSYEEVKERLQKKGISVTVEQLKNGLRIQKKTKLGYVLELKVQDKTIKGEAWQEWFSLPSMNFYLEDYQDELRMISLGKGRGLGFSQYGANEMAKEKATYEEILKYYYKGVALNKITESGNDTRRGDENEEN